MKPKHLETLLDWLYPRHCPFCDKLLLPSAQGICNKCRESLSYITEPICKKCGKQLHKEESEYCKDCKQHSHVFDYGMALLSYQGAIKHSLYRFKYGGRMEYAKVYAEEMAKKFAPIIRFWEADAIIPIPLHKKREQKRGFNQAELIARHLGKQFQTPVYADLVKRIKNTIPQKKLDVKERQNNLKRAFKISQNEVKLSTVVMIDDIYTTGCTMNAMAQELKRCGVKKIFYLSVAIGEN